MNTILQAYRSTYCVRPGNSIILFRELVLQMQRLVTWYFQRTKYCFCACYVTKKFINLVKINNWECTKEKKKFFLNKFEVQKAYKHSISYWWHYNQHYEEKKIIIKSFQYKYIPISEIILISIKTQSYSNKNLHRVQVINLTSLLIN